MNYWTQDKTEVRYHRLRPAEAVARRKAMPVAYVPLGTIEWHGVHNPLGSDTLQAEGIAIVAARKGGGLVMPPVYFGDVRVQGEIIETLPEHHNDRIAAYMELPLSNFDADKFPYTKGEQIAHYHHHLMQILYQVQSLGFKACVFVAGHYPLIRPARGAAEAFNERNNPMKAWAFVDYEQLESRYDYAGDHAAYWETSHMLCLYPELVDMSRLPAKGEPLLGIVPNNGHLPQDADAAFGYRIIEEVADIAIEKVRTMLG